MTIKKKSKAIQELEAIRKSPLFFKDLLNSIRVTEEMTQTELAELSGTSKAKVCDFEKGRRTPTLELAAKMAKALGHSEVLFVSKLIQEQIENANLKLKVSIEAT
jgi:transcriptional regulator with XRE-family HTH domain